MDSCKSEMAKPIEGMIPPGSWHYFQSDVKLTGDSLNDLYKVVEEHRANNSLPLGDVKGDVNNYICGNWPTFCHGVDSVTINVGHWEAVTRSAELLQDISTWANNLLRSMEPYTLVQDQEAERRAAICAQCPNNAAWRSGCGSCINAADRACAAVRQARETSNAKKLGGCSLLRHDNRTAVFIDKEKLASSGNLPTNCWLT
jgi:hypothetical protein